ncbi:unnamed protein product [Malus baccata var. baccata]
MPSHFNHSNPSTTNNGFLLISLPSLLLITLPLHRRPFTCQNCLFQTKSPCSSGGKRLLYPAIPHHLQPKNPFCTHKTHSRSWWSPTCCNSAQCSLSNSKSCTIDCYSSLKPGCNNNTCALSPGNTVTRTSTNGDLGQDTVSLQSIDGSNPGRLVYVPNLFFICGPIFLLEGLASGVKGMAGLAQNMSQSKHNSLIFTPLIINPVNTVGAYFQGEPSVEYFINVKSIKVNGKVVSLNTSLLAIDNEGYGGTKISTVNPYMVLETSIYNAVVNAFVKEVANKIPRVKAVVPFRACFSSKNIGVTRVGPSVPSIDLVLQSESVHWTMFRANSMVYVSNDVLCLGFVDGGEKPRTSIVIGGHQLEDNLLQFDLGTSRLGFSSSLLFSRTTCGNFNFTSNA